jgi:hypothetical protein
LDFPGFTLANATALAIFSIALRTTTNPHYESFCELKLVRINVRASFALVCRVERVVRFMKRKTRAFGTTFECNAWRDVIVICALTPEIADCGMRTRAR